MATPNSLGLDFDQLKIQDSQPASSSTELTSSSESQPPSDTSSPPKQNQAPPIDSREKKKPYVNTERVKTGGSQRDKLSEEALVERMARMREQNEKIKQRRLDVKADEEAFRKTQESERAKLAQIRKVQDNVDRTREQNAKRKMDKIQSREWDSGKPTGDWKHQSKKAENAPIHPTDEGNKAEESQVRSPARDSGSWVRGSPREGSQRGRGRGRGRGGSVTTQRDTNTPTDAEPVLSSNSADAETPQEGTLKEATS
ncbi:hypothetical protein D9615_001749 [Tricholomella constricta]|uniref:Uncharacterized protein n=1 Tax=Tricholomella constricta TaxID=117010 RepID=A0A8H5HNJ3_9AGAR|nr:hypothetical protein D9615_001749 [Tricholomella constricta]